MNKQKIIIVSVLVLLIGVSLWLILRKPKVKSNDIVIDFPLKAGSKGYGVSQVQKYMNDKYSAGLKVDGNWGPATTAASMLYLKRDNISSDIFYKWNLDKA